MGDSSPPDVDGRLGVIIGGESLLGCRSGVGRMTLEIVRAARACPAVGRVELLAGEWLLPASTVDDIGEDGVRPGPAPVPIPWKVAIGRIPGVQALRRLKHGGLNRAIRRLRRDLDGCLVYHEPNMITTPLRVPTVSTINDLSWHHEPSWHPRERLDWIERNLERTLRQSRRFVAISHFTRNAAVETLGLPVDRVDVVPLAPAAEFRPYAAAEAAPVLRRHGLVDQGYILSVSTLEPRKNFDQLLAAYLHFPPDLHQRTPLVIAGGKGWGEVLIRPEAEAAIRSGSVRLLGHVRDNDLAALYSRSAVFAFVSLYEGFGLPVVEAMATGCPVLASSTTGVGEVAGAAACLVDPLDVGAIATGLRELLEDRELAGCLAQAGLARAAEFTWTRTIRGLAESWRRAL
jgi:alpha-1,3-rhamnosyl/mannosyltransferase